MAPQTPRVIAVAASKGGVGRSTLATALAVRAVKDGGTVTLFDHEPQGSASLWHRLRGSPANPALRAASGNIVKDVAALKAAGVRWTIVDTPPDRMTPIERAIEASDVVLIPVRVGLFDMAAVRPVIGFCQMHSRPFLFVLNCTNPDAPGWPALIKSAVAICKQHGPVLPKTIRERAAWISALNSGRTGPESSLADQAKAAGVEIDALWDALKRLARGRAK